jgi:hypothetical protein
MNVRLITRDDIEFTPAEVARWLERGGMLVESAGRTYLVPRLMGARGGAKADLSKPIAGIESAAGKMGGYADVASAGSQKYMASSEAALGPIMSYYQDVMKGGKSLMGAIAPGVSTFTKQRAQATANLGNSLMDEYKRLSFLLNNPIPAMAQQAQMGAVAGMEGLGKWYGGEAGNWFGRATDATAAQGSLFGLEMQGLNEQARQNAAAAAARNNMIAGIGKEVGGPLLKWRLDKLATPATVATAGAAGAGAAGAGAAGASALSGFPIASSPWAGMAPGALLPGYGAATGAPIAGAGAPAVASSGGAGAAGSGLLGTIANVAAPIAFGATLIAPNVLFNRDKYRTDGSQVQEDGSGVGYRYDDPNAKYWLQGEPVTAQEFKLKMGAWPWEYQLPASYTDQFATAQAPANPYVGPENLSYAEWIARGGV